ncbi:MAG: glycine cleavage system protein GcvH [Planctomycetaceae bacterium]|nr:glycine cleavage system protein GcvH [Planctomycetaceae bacterium]MCP4463862.1 glycine cleavage system protein GcvH [Planctomycetaceae bacterium]MDG1806694.1 glycine cleavage system protein GcvH [Pirellulaceae bacterium]MDG2103733.1 glycine cleavage system protein GcvH [Pirellulaceae bacterium]
MNQEELLYAPTHEWVHVGEDGIATIGITDFAVEQLTDLVYMELPDVGATVTAGEEFGEVESVKAVSPLYSPISGEVIEVNSGLPDELEVLGTDAFGAGWIAKIKMDGGAPESLLNHTTYKTQIAGEG